MQSLSKMDSMEPLAIDLRKWPRVGKTRGRVLDALRCIPHTENSIAVARLGRYCAFATRLIGVRRVIKYQLITFVFIIFFNEAT